MYEYFLSYCMHLTKGPRNARLPSALLLSYYVTIDLKTGYEMRKLCNLIFVNFPKPLELK